MRSKAPALTLVALMSCAALTACGGGGKSKASATPSVTSTPTPAATPTPVVVAKDFLTGLAPRQTGPVAAIKIDNAFLAEPFQRGLTSAAIVYQELVEGGSTRFLGVFESGIAGTTQIGPIRSVRSSDVDLLREFDGIDVGFSGGNTGVKAIFNAAARKGYVVNASYDVDPSAYVLGARRADARNFFASASSLTTAHPGKGPVDIGFRFSTAVPIGGGLAPAATARFSPDSVLHVRYVAGRYVLSEGSHVIPVSPANVVIQYVGIRAAGFVDVHGQPTPYTVSTGPGKKAIVLRNGHRYIGTWRRTGFGATHFVNAAGQDMPLAPGPTWVVLLPSAQGSVSYP